MLLQEFKTVKNICTTPAAELGLLPGLGDKKITRFREVMTKPWRKKPRKSAEEDERKKTRDDEAGKMPPKNNQNL